MKISIYYYVKILNTREIGSSIQLCTINSKYKVRYNKLTLDEFCVETGLNKIMRYLLCYAISTGVYSNNDTRKPLYGLKFKKTQIIKIFL